MSQYYQLICKIREKSTKKPPIVPEIWDNKDSLFVRLTVEKNYYEYRFEFIIPCNDNQENAEFLAGELHSLSLEIFDLTQNKSETEIETLLPKWTKMLQAKINSSMDFLPKP